MNRRQEESNRACPDCRSAKKENTLSAVKTSKIIAGLLVMLGFVACEPEEEVESGCPPSGVIIPAYGVIPCAYESKSAVPDVDETVEAVEFILTETEE